MGTLFDGLESWSPPADWLRITAIDVHTEGEPLRVILAGFPRLRGGSVLERRHDARTHHDELRRALMWEPRGHADMYGCIVGPPVTGGAEISVVFTHNEGFSTMCGHGIIGVVKVLLDLDLLGDASSAGDGVRAPAERTVGIDSPAGFIRATASLGPRGVRSVAFENVPSFAARVDATVDVPGVGPVKYDLAYGGAFYAYVRAADFGLRLVPSEVERLVALGRAVKEAVQDVEPPVHPDSDDLGFMYGTIFVGPAHDRAHHSRNVCVFADGEVDRSPTGTGVSGRLALHDARGELRAGAPVVIESILGTCFAGRIVARARVGDVDAIVPEVSGRAWITGRNELLLDPEDPLRHGFLLR